MSGAECCGEDKGMVFPVMTPMKVIFVQVFLHSCTTTPESAKSSWKSFEGFLFAFLAILQAVLSESFLNLPDLNLAATITINCYFLITLQNEETATWKHFAIFLQPFPALSASIFFKCSARQLLREAHGCWLLGHGFKESENVTSLT